MAQYFETVCHEDASYSKARKAPVKMLTAEMGRGQNAYIIALGSPWTLGHRYKTRLSCIALQKDALLWIECGKGSPARYRKPCLL
jgi:hypothetical protein